MSFTITVGGSPVDGLLDVNYNGVGTAELGQAEIEVKNNSFNRTFTYGDEVVIKRDGDTVWTGYLEKYPPSGDRNIRLNLTARDKREELQYVEVHRPFYDIDSGTAVQKMVDEKVQPQSPVLVHTGDTLTDWTADIPIFELADLPSQDLNKYGTNLLFAYWEADNTGEYTATFDAVPTNAADDGRILWLETGFLVNNRGNFFELELELRDHAGNNYVWTVPVPDGQEYVETKLPAEAANPDGDLTTNGTLEYRFTIGGGLPEARAGVIDYARTRPFSTTPRDAGVSTADVTDTGRDIVRRIDATVFESVAQLATEDGAVSYVDADDDLHYEPSGDVDAPESITHSGTRVTHVDADKDATDIVNKVTVQGAGDLQVTLQDSGSIQFYGVSERSEPLVNKEIQQAGELRDYGEGYLDENAWSDTAVTFTIADAAYKNVVVGQRITVAWPPLDLSGEFSVSETETDTVGKVTVGITGSDA
jgi:hypothetical protein